MKLNVFISPSNFDESLNFRNFSDIQGVEIFCFGFPDNDGCKTCK
jgi:hypothetical protein